jgi:peroxiredoxin
MGGQVNDHQDVAPAAPAKAAPAKAAPAKAAPAKGRRNPIVIFLGFVLLGGALALLIFGQDLFMSDEVAPAAIVGEAEVAVLDQVSELPSFSGETSTTRDDDGFLEVGDTAYNFTLDDLNGQPVSLTDFRGRPVIVNFWATWCAPCRIEMPVFQELYERHQDDGLVILALDQAEPPEVARDYFYDQMGLTFTPLLDVDSQVATEYGSHGVLPSTFFIDSAGSVAAIHRGPLTEGQAVGYLAAAGIESS